jgi:clan AA aspartic protease
MLGSVAEDGSEPLLPLGLIAGTDSGGGEGTLLEVEAVVDTGFDGELTLPSEAIRQLGYPYAGSAGGTLADGSEVQFDYHEGRVLWHGVMHPVAVIAAEGQPLAGMALLRGSHLSVEA